MGHTFLIVWYLWENMGEVSRIDVWYLLRSWGGFGTLNADMAGGVSYGELEKSVQALDIGAGTGIF